MTANSRDPEKFEQILRLYNEAESFIKEVELCVSEIAFPAINELRYSGHHLLKALVSAGPEQFDKELSDAVDHCHRSMYESSEAGIGYLLDLLKAFDTDYRDVPVVETVPDYVEIRALAKNVALKLSQGRLNRSSPRGQASDYMDMFRKLREGVDKLEASRSELNKRKKEQAEASRKFIIQVVFWIAMILIGIAGIVMSVVTP